jgi:hypothetical protein
LILRLGIRPAQIKGLGQGLSGFGCKADAGDPSRIGRVRSGRHDGINTGRQGLDRNRAGRRSAQRHRPAADEADSIPYSEESRSDHRPSAGRNQLEVDLAMTRIDGRGRETPTIA